MGLSAPYILRCDGDLKGDIRPSLATFLSFFFFLLRTIANSVVMACSRGQKWGVCFSGFWKTLCMVLALEYGTSISNLELSQGVRS